MVLGVLAGILLQELTEANWVVREGPNGLEARTLDPESQRARWLAPLVMVADIFMRLLKMLIVPLILTSIITGVTKVACGREFGRLGAKTLAYYMLTSLLAISSGLLLVNLLQPGTGAELGLTIPATFEAGEGVGLARPLQRVQQRPVAHNHPAPAAGRGPAGQTPSPPRRGWRRTSRRIR